MAEVIVAVFDTMAHAEAAERDLEAAGFSVNVRRYTGDTTGTTSGTISRPTTTDTSSGGGFWSWLLGDDASTTTHRSYGGIWVTP